MLLRLREMKPLTLVSSVGLLPLARTHQTVTSMFRLLFSMESTLMVHQKVFGKTVGMKPNYTGMHPARNIRHQ